MVVRMKLGLKESRLKSNWGQNSNDFSILVIKDKEKACVLFFFRGKFP